VAAHGAYGDVKRTLLTLLPELRAARGAKRFVWLGVGFGGAVLAGVSSFSSAWTAT